MLPKNGGVCLIVAATAECGAKMHRFGGSHTDTPVCRSDVFVWHATYPRAVIYVYLQPYASYETCAITDFRRRYYRFSMHSIYAGFGHFRPHVRYVTDFLLPRGPQV